MCHQSVGLVQHAVESAGIPVISIALRPEITWASKVSRASYLRFPTGNPLGEPNRPEQHLTILRAVLQALVAIDQPGTIAELPFRWRRM
ncbi:MAG: prdB 1 [Firmicutes bacterium]|nr:prdB 1 [Bacillota bacterium]